MTNFIINFVRNKFKKLKSTDKQTDLKEPIQKEGSNTRHEPSPKPGGEQVVSQSRPKRQRRPQGQRKPRPPRENQITAPREQEPPKERWDISSFQVEHVEGKTRFHDLNLPHSIMHAIADEGFQYCTPIQAEILPATLAGRDASGQAQTGTGKTAAFLITIFTRLLRKRLQEKQPFGTPRALILAPTRELVLQIAKDAYSLNKYTPIRVAAVFGGMDYRKQKQQFKEKGADVIVATPGRLLDFQKQKIVDLSKVEILIIDEADRMLDMGFIPDVRKIINSTPQKDERQTLFFSATLTDEVQRLSARWTHDPLMVEIEPEHIAADTVDQVIYIVTTKEKYALLYNIITRQNLHRVLVFCNRKDETRKLANMLYRYGSTMRCSPGIFPKRNA